MKMVGRAARSAAVFGFGLVAVAMAGCASASNDGARARSAATGACVDVAVGERGAHQTVERAGEYTITLGADGDDKVASGRITGPDGAVDFRIDEATGALTTSTSLPGDAVARFFAGASAAFEPGADVCGDDEGTIKTSALHTLAEPESTIRCSAEGQKFETADSKVTATAFTTLAAFWVHHVGSAVGIAWYNAREDRAAAARELGACCYEKDPNFESHYCNRVYWLYWPLSVPGKP
jgi:hypothetical protein